MARAFLAPCCGVSERIEIINFHTFRGSQRKSRVEPLKRKQMTPEFVTSIGRQTIEVILIISAPVLIVGMVVGLAVSIFQAVTQIQEMTLTFVPKIIAVFLVLLALSGWIMQKMMGFTTEIFTNIPNYIR